MNKIIKVLCTVALLGTAINAKVIATVNGYPITSGEANKAIKIASKGKIKDYRKLSPNDRKRLIKALATDKLVIKEANRVVPKNQKKLIYVDFYAKKHFKELLKKAEKELTKKEKETIVADVWVRQQSLKYRVSEKEMKKVYNRNKRLFKDKKTGKLIPYKKIKPLIKMQLQQKKFVTNLMKHAKIDYNPSAKKKK